MIVVVIVVVFPCFTGVHDATYCVYRAVGYGPHQITNFLYPRCYEGTGRTRVTARTIRPGGHSLQSDTLFLSVHAEIGRSLVRVALSWSFGPPPVLFQ